jgi:DNA-directed RNA polymerase subunit RPC12/RpoP
MAVYFNDDWYIEDSEEWELRAERFRDPGGRSALHPGDQIYPCPTCGEEERLTLRDVKAGYQCDECADRAEGVW